MGIMTRLLRIFKADIHGVMDQLEDRSLLLKQYLRDMEEALEQKDSRLGRVVAARNQAQQASEKYRLEIEKLEQDLAVAIKKEKDEIARLLIKKIIPLTKIRDGVRHHLDNLDQEIDGIKECIDQQRMQYEHLKHQSRQFFHKAEQDAWQKSDPIIDPNNISEALSDEEIEIELLQRKEALS
jgi:phage shock protein A